MLVSRWDSQFPDKRSIVPIEKIGMDCMAGLVIIWPVKVARLSWHKARHSNNVASIRG